MASRRTGRAPCRWFPPSIPTTSRAASTRRSSCGKTTRSSLMRNSEPPVRPTPMRKASAWPRPIATPSITRWRMTAFSFDGLRNFMQGLVDGGPTPSGHRTPMVFVTLPAWGFDGPSMRANVWQIHQALAAGAHGCLICEMELPEAGRDRHRGRALQMDLAGRGGASHRRRAGRRQPGFRRAHLGPQPGRVSACRRYLAAQSQGRDHHGLQAGEPPLRHGGRAADGDRRPGLCRARSQRQWLVPPAVGCDPGRSDARNSAPPCRPPSAWQEDLERIRLAAKANNVKWLGNGPPGATPQQEIDQGRRMGPAGTEERVQADRLYTKRKMPY